MCVCVCQGRGVNAALAVPSPPGGFGCMFNVCMCVCVCVCQGRGVDTALAVPNLPGGFGCMCVCVYVCVKVGGLTQH